MVGEKRKTMIETSSQIQNWQLVSEQDPRAPNVNPSWSSNGYLVQHCDQGKVHGG
jgi:hypothetical protein